DVGGPRPIQFTGAGPQGIRLMGDKSRAKKAMIKAGVPVVPGSQGVLEDEEKAVKGARDIGFPAILKASAGGGGGRAPASGGRRAWRRIWGLRGPRRRRLSAFPTSTSRGTCSTPATSRSR